MKKVISVILAALLVMSAASFSSFAVSDVQTQIETAIATSQAAGKVTAEVAWSGNSFTAPLDITVPANFTLTVNFNGAECTGETGVTGEALINLRGSGTIVLQNLTAKASYGSSDSASIDYLNTPAIRLFDSVVVTVFACNITGTVKKNFIGSVTTGDAIEMMTDSCKLAVINSTLKGVLAVDTTANGTHNAATCTLTNTTVDTAKTTFDQLAAIAKNILNLFLEMFKNIIKVLPKTAA